MHAQEVFIGSYWRGPFGVKPASDSGMLDISWLRVSTNVTKGFGYVSLGTADGCFGEGYTVDLVIVGAAALRCEVFFIVKLGGSFGSCDAIRGLLSAAYRRCGWYIARK